MTAMRRTRRGDDDDIAALRAEYADEEAEAVEAEIAERTASLDVPLNLRISRALDDALRRRAADEQIRVSALVRRLLADALSASTLDAAAIETIARRVVREELSGRKVVNDA